MADGSFYFRGKDWSYDILNAEGYGGEEWQGYFNVAEHIQETDRIFYSVDDGHGETYYRWVGGPFVSMDDLEAAIMDAVEYYE